MITAKDDSSLATKIGNFLSGGKKKASQTSTYDQINTSGKLTFKSGGAGKTLVHKLDAKKGSNLVFGLINLDELQLVNL